MKNGFMYSHLWFKPIMSSLVKWSHNCFILYIIFKTVELYLTEFLENVFLFSLLPNHEFNTISSCNLI